jgi:hypothetical protein
MTSEMSALVADLKNRIDQIVAAARDEGRAQALAEIRSLVGGGEVSIKRGPGRPRSSANKPKSDKRKSSWSSMTPEARLARVNAIRKGKGLSPKDTL